MKGLVKLRRLLEHYSYTVPWCVPNWGFSEFRVTMSCLFGGEGVVAGSSPVLFAAAAKAFLGVSYAIPVNFGRVAIELALRAMDLRENDEVVIPSYICQSVMDAVSRAGAKPVFADIGCNLQLTSETVAAALTPRTKCVIVPHLFGAVAPIDQIERLLEGKGISLVDDAAQSFGSFCGSRAVGTFGICGIVSCGPGKPLTGPAGGLFVTNDRALYERARSVVLGVENSRDVALRLLGFWIWRRFRRWTLPWRVLIDRTWRPSEETPYRACAMSNADGAIALVQLRQLKRNTAQRRVFAQSIAGLLPDGIQHIISEFGEGSNPVKLIAILPKNRLEAEDVIERLAEAGIECRRGYAPCHRSMNISANLPATEDLWRRVVEIPVNTNLGPMDVK